MLQHSIILLIILVALYSLAVQLKSFWRSSKQGPCGCACSGCSRGSGTNKIKEHSLAPPCDYRQSSRKTM